MAVIQLIITSIDAQTTSIPTCKCLRGNGKSGQTCMATSWGAPKAFVSLRTFVSGHWKEEWHKFQAFFREPARELFKKKVTTSSNIHLPVIDKAGWSQLLKARKPVTHISHQCNIGIMSRVPLEQHTDAFPFLLRRAPRKSRQRDAGRVPCGPRSFLEGIQQSSRLGTLHLRVLIKSRILTINT